MADEPAVQIRPCRPGDREQVMAIAPRLAEWVASWRDQDAVLAAVHGWVRDSVDSCGQPGHAAYVAALGQQVAGFVSVSERTHFTGQVDAYVGEAAERGLPFLTLETGAANRPARGLYRALGYQEEDVRLTKAVLPRP
jgi:ribosomal protein S18 acetylase RimI-like enzyme